MQSGKSGIRGLAGFAALTALVFGAGLYSLNVSAQPKLDIHFVPTPHHVVKRMLELAKVGPNDVHYDLGSGDGRIVIAAVKDFKAKKGVGIDLDPQRIKESNENKAKAASATTSSSANRTSSRPIFRKQPPFRCICSPPSISACARSSSKN